MIDQTAAVLSAPAASYLAHAASLLAQLADERNPIITVDCDDRDRARMADDLAFVAAPALDVDADQLPLEDPS